MRKIPAHQAMATGVSGRKAAGEKVRFERSPDAALKKVITE
jgi:hypothetical protein